VRSFLRELILEIVNRGELHSRDRVHASLCRLLIVELSSASAMAANVSLPRDPRAAAIARELVANPGLRVTLRSMCASAGLSVRTLERLFRKETGIDFETWRRQLRLMRAVEMLVGGQSVKEVAFAVGYQQPSAFVEAFRKVYCTTPKRWVSALTE
jgi:transcriptional regulator GlxA family with amidase domain